MYLFSRRRQANPAQLRQAMSVATEATTRVQQITGHDFAAWSTVLSPNAGTVVWATFAEHLEELSTAADKLAVDSTFQEWVEANDACFVGPTHDSVVQLLHGAPSGDAPDYVLSVRGRCAAGQLAEGVTKGIELAQGHAERTGLPTSFGTGLTGAFGSVIWIAGFRDMETLERANAALDGDPSWAAALDAAGNCYEPDAEVTIYRRLA